MIFSALRKHLIGAFILLTVMGVQLNAQEGQGKIALLFLTRKDLNFPRVWQGLLVDSKEKYSVYVHSKEPLCDPYFKNYRIDRIVPTTWSIHARAWQALIQEALKDPQNMKFVFLSEACVPMYPLIYIYDVLMEYPYSYMAYARPWWPPRDPREVSEINPAHRYGGSEWTVLNRKHAEIVANDWGIIRIVSRHNNDQESYFPTLLSVYNCLSEVFNRSYTYANWHYASNGGASPYVFEEYNELSKELIADAYSIGCLFLRKVAKTFPEEVLFKNIDVHSGDYIP